MREIKFRGKTKEGKWIYGSYCTSGENHHRKNKHYIVNGNPFQKYIGRYFTEVNPETIGQLLFTNPYSESFYDGDIIDINQTINGCSQFVLKQGVYGIDIWYHDRVDYKYEYDVIEFLNMLMYNDFGEVKVIGNIHDKTKNDE